MEMYLKVTLTSVNVKTTADFKQIYLFISQLVIINCVQFH